MQSMARSNKGGRQGDATMDADEGVRDGGFRRPHLRR
jgi:hypothetical protein